jgi:hypothetical protein
MKHLAIRLAVQIFVAGAGLASVGALAAEGAATGGTELTAALTGVAEVPPGDSDASGTFTATFNAAHDQLCYELTVMKMETPTAAHIHQGAAGQNGGPVVPLAAPANGSSKGCVAVDPTIAAKLMQNPGDYYVNVHNAPYPNGGLRGQLAKK